MSIVKMSKASLAGRLADRDRLIARVMKLGLVEIVSYDVRNAHDGYPDLLYAETGADGADGAAGYEYEMNRVDAAIRLIEQYAPEKKPMFWSGRTMKADEYKSIVHDLDRVRAIAGKVADIEVKLTALRTEENRLNTVVASLQPWRAMPLPLDFGGTESASVVFGVAPAAAMPEQMRSELAECVPESFFETVGVDRESQYLVVAAHRSCEEAALQALKKHGFSRVQFGDLSGTSEQNISDASARLSENAKGRADAERQLKQLAPLKYKLEALHDYLEIRAERKKIVSKLGRSDSVFYLEGWLPQKSAGQFVSEMEAEADCYIQIEEPKKGEDHPILLDNPRAVRPFEAITAMYSLPSARDADPNILMAPFYFIFFGMMIGDFAYGLILSAVAGFMLLKLKPRGMAKQILAMLVLGGVSTVFWGAMFGSCFGNLPQALANWFTGTDSYAGKFYGLWFDPITDPMKLLIFSMLLGVAHLFVGMGIKMYTLIRDGMIFEAIFDVGSWYVLIAGIPLLMLNIFPGLYLTVAGAAMLVFTQGRSSKNPVMKLLNGLLSLYGITGYLGDVLSYSRLLALGLATGVIAAVINTLATLNKPGVVSVIVCLVIVAVGTAFNVAVNALGAFVHASRLQYVEFFGKFYEGGGEAFKPFAIKTKYIKIV